LGTINTLISYIIGRKIFNLPYNHMLLTENITSEGIECTYESSNISKSVYSPQTLTLKIHFKRGGVYEYSPVNPHQHHMFAIAESQGKKFIESFKNNKNMSFKKVS
jgi:hypothetical protein